ncbi:MAG TPA: OmpA family protein [Gemmatimonadales bacterium]|nr:OmpA family protein [Gemmatimonadales bacterium]
MRLTLLAVPAALAVSASACHHAAPPPVAVQPQVDSSAMVRARQDSIARAEARATEQREEQRRADSLAALKRHSADLQATLASLVHFDFDRSNLRPEDVRALDAKIPILTTNSTVRLQIVGNCDERGSDEYNLALGNRRAITAKQYLVAHGVDASRIQTLSYGKERPLDPAHNEAAWAMNRNDEFEMLTQSVVLR